jgi:thiol-disulfide isomerase/thioredoxin
MPATTLLLIYSLVWMASPAPRDDPPTAGPSRIAVTLEPGEPGSPLAPRFSPKGTQLQLAPKVYDGLAGHDKLEARVSLGPEKQRAGLGQLLVLARSAPGKPYDLLYVDANRDQRLSEAPLRVTPTLTRGKFWSSFTTTLAVFHGTRDGQVLKEDYPVSLWVVADKEDERPTIIRFSRRGFLTGKVTLAGAEYAVVLSDSNNDGIFKAGDWWGLRGPDGKGELDRAVGDYAWSGGKAWKLELDGTNGRKGTLVSFNPGVTQEEDSARRDRLRADRLAPRAEKPVAFRKDVDEAFKEVASRKAPYFVKFETDWCVPCKQMAQLVFTARNVAEGSRGVTCIVVDGDARKDLVERHGVKGYPTGILFDGDGKEVARYSGYQGVKEMTQFFGKLKH